MRRGLSEADWRARGGVAVEEHVLLAHDALVHRGVPSPADCSPGTRSAMAVPTRRRVAGVVSRGAVRVRAADSARDPGATRAVGGLPDRGPARHRARRPRALRERRACPGRLVRGAHRGGVAMKCHDHGRDPCTEPRCQVLVRCWSEVPAFSPPFITPEGASWLTTHRYAWASRPWYAIAGSMADRLVTWMRWQGAMVGPGFHHSLDERLPYRERIRALSSEDDPDGANWETVLVFLDWLHARGWSWQEVHDWRP